MLPVSIPMTVLGGLQLYILFATKVAERVSIPMTVLGGLQLDGYPCKQQPSPCFNTDDGIRRAAI